MRSWKYIGIISFAALWALAACDNGQAGSGAATKDTSSAATAVGQPSGTVSAENSAKAAPSASASADTAASADASSEPAGSADPNGDASAAPDSSGAGSTGSTPGTDGSSAAPEASSKPATKDWGCGKKGQKACPMQGWMKGVMARAVAGGDKDKIAAALNTIAAKPPPGMGSWTGIAAAGAAKAAAGDIDGAKVSCKKCHSLYQKKYKDTMRGNPW